MVLTLGVDIGIASIGWAVIEGERTDKGIKDRGIIESGVRIFTRAENPKDKASLALPRRSARSARRRTARKRGRIAQIKSYLSQTLGLDSKCFLQEERLAPIFQTSKNFISPWELRERALYRELNKEELARVILHIAKHRGYDDITYGIEDNEDGKIKKAIAQNIALIKQEAYQTVGEMMFKLYCQRFLRVRNKKDDYNHCIGRSELKEELLKIFNIQKDLGNPCITQEFCTTLLGNARAEDKQSL